MKIFYSPASPFVRKALVLAHEVGLADTLERVAAKPHPINRDKDIVALNPLGKIPTLILEDGSAIYDSRVVCEYLDSLHEGTKLFPEAGPARWKALSLQALADGLMDAAILVRYEHLARADGERSTSWVEGQNAKIDSSLDGIERAATDFDDTLTIGTITIGCALGYLDLRFGDRDWRASHPKTAAWFAEFSKRPSMLATEANL